MIRRLLAAIAATSLAWLGCFAPSQIAAAAAPAPVMAHVDDGHYTPSQFADLVDERAPPTGYDLPGIRDAVNHWLHGVPARVETAATNGYNDRSVRVQIDNTGTTTLESARGPEFDSASSRPSGVAAKAVSGIPDESAAVIRSIQKDGVIVQSGVKGGLRGHPSRAPSSTTDARAASCCPPLTATVKPSPIGNGGPCQVRRIPSLAANE